MVGTAVNCLSATAYNAENREKSQKLESKLVFNFSKHRFSCQNAPKEACFSVSTNS
jgi:hypothetical protein